MIRYLIYIVLFCSGLMTAGVSTAAGPHYKEIQSAIVLAADKKTKTINVRGYTYKLRQGVKIHDSGKNFPSLSSLEPGMKVLFRTRINKRSGEVEISELWIERE